ncbi:hypothetical protein [Salinithrix halophila]|uniref:Uncharacterized protein n=1 Tax=Salinithrix halophila TaxID=1485204 RepID=A0ABV8JDD3_9BACL
MRNNNEEMEWVRLRLFHAQAEVAVKLFSWLERPGADRDPRVQAGLQVWKDLCTSCRLVGAYSEREEPNMEKTVDS